jgi:uncharacterized membrane protein
LLCYNDCMKPTRLDQLSDGIFAIVLTFLTFDLKIHALPHPTPDQALWDALVTIGPILLSFILSFALIFTYWRAHHYIVSVYAKNIDSRLTSINALFFFFIALIPFSTRLLGEYSETRLAIIIYAANIIMISITLLWMREYVLSSGHLSHSFVTKYEKRRGAIRIVVPMLCAAAAMGICFYSTWAAFFLLTFAIVFNLLSRSTRMVNWILVKTKEEFIGSGEPL